MKYSVCVSAQNKSGIYGIRSLLDGKIYIGSAYRIRQRFLEHRSRLERGVHHSPYLQRHASKYGVNVLDFWVIELCDIDILLDKEQFYINLFSPEFNGTTNVRRPRLGIKASDELRLRLSIAAKNRKPVTEEFRKKMSNITKGRKLSEAQRLGSSMRQKGVKFTNEHCKSLSEAAKRRKKQCHTTPHTQEAKDKMSAARKGKKSGFDSHVAIRLKNTITGEIYPSFKYAAMSEGIKTTTLWARIMVSKSPYHIVKLNT